MINTYRKIRNTYNWGRMYLEDPHHIYVNKRTEEEINKVPLRSDIINFLIKSLNKPEITYLEIGVRNPTHNFNKIEASKKYSVDPGLEFKENPVDFKVTSDVFFSQLREGKVLTKETKFDVIFVDGLHLADQVDRDIKNALEFISDEGFIVMHDCNPPCEEHARERHDYRMSAALSNWNGTTWKAFFKCRQREDVFSCCVDTDWGVGVISKTVNLGKHSTVQNPYFEYFILNENRSESLNLVTFEQLKQLVQKNK